MLRKTYAMRVLAVSVIALMAIARTHAEDGKGVSQLLADSLADVPVLALHGSAIPPGKAGMPPPQEIRKGGDGQFVIRVMGMGEVKVVPGSVVEAYLRAYEMVRSEKLLEAIGVLEPALEQPLDLQAVVPIDGSISPEQAAAAMTVPILMSIRHLVEDLCDRLRDVHVYHEQEFERLSTVCLQIPIHVAKATPPTLGCVVQAQALLREASTACEESLKACRQYKQAGRIAVAREEITEHFRKYTGPLMEKFAQASLDMWEVMQKVGITESDYSEIEGDMHSTEAFVARRLCEGWLKVVEINLPDGLGFAAPDPDSLGR